MGRDAAEGRLQEFESNVKETFEGYERAGIYWDRLYIVSFNFQHTMW